jgi:hypothetical protein
MLELERHTGPVNSPVESLADPLQREKNAFTALLVPCSCQCHMHMSYLQPVNDIVDPLPGREQVCVGGCHEVRQVEIRLQIHMRRRPGQVLQRK